ncbi:hypothetical protein, partial [Klebsiella pneumoniae]|uniref:hypothetical protein n=1 Tax=Klebsiella pneumoniae TaxID=573 RepID=UPI002731E362
PSLPPSKQANKNLILKAISEAQESVTKTTNYSTDEELPDYIMVMVANKKSQDQMTEDLSLFLGNNTIRFTVWLHGVLDKLRSVTTEP